jgi:hypothetical protein
MKHKTAELEAGRLDYAVALIEGLDVTSEDCGLSKNGKFVRVKSDGTAPYMDFSPSTCWDHGGPIIERNHIDVAAPDEFDDDERWFAGIYRDAMRHATPRCCEMRGDTPLIAAMRAYVASWFGEEVEIP